ncbi:MAG TPA: hydantoinase B/oxoprolinase family protein [Alphaproteobacteria bacterium]|jgi:N-methylhydantoinase B
MDPITLEVINSSLAAHADEMTNSFWRSSYSYMNYEVRDFAVGFIDREGSIVMQSRYTHPAFTGDLGYVVKATVDIIGESEIEEGDMIATNDPSIQGQHLNNVVVFTPVFIDGKIFAYSCVRAHLHDVGGATIGSGSPSSTEVFAEGLQICAARIYRAGKPAHDMLRMIEANTRFPDLVMGDLNAQVAACKLGVRRLTELVNTYGAETTTQAVRAGWDMAERAARKAVAEIPDGSYTAESYLDNDGVNLNSTVPIKVRVEVKGEEMVIDFSEIADQVRGSMNSGFYGGATNVGRIAFKCLTTPHMPSIEGCFRPLKIICPEGKILNARRPAALKDWSVPFPTIIDTIFKALSQAIVGRVPAATRGDARGSNVKGFDPKRRKYFTIHLPHPGGHGARPHADGPAPKCSIQQGNEHSMPIEINETKTPVIFEKVELRQDSGGAGRYRGGLGVDVVANFTLESKVRNRMTRVKCAPWGLHGGLEGAINESRVIEEDGEKPLSRGSDYTLPVGRSIRILTGGGGGYGHPFDRPAEKVRDDVADGYISGEAAASKYGVVLTAKGDVDVKETQSRRASRSGSAE